MAKGKYIRETPNPRHNNNVLARNLKCWFTSKKPAPVKLEIRPWAHQSKKFMGTGVMLSSYFRLQVFLCGTDNAFRNGIDFLF